MGGDGKHQSSTADPGGDQLALGAMLADDPSIVDGEHELSPSSAHAGSPVAAQWPGGPASFQPAASIAPPSTNAAVQPGEARQLAAEEGKEWLWRA